MNACILDPEAKQSLTPQKSKKFQYFIFGGILGNHPPQKRTHEELSQDLKLSKFNIGKKQMSTDNAVYVVKKIIQGTPLTKILFINEIEIQLNKIQSTILPYRYVLIKNKPLISKELINYFKSH